MALALGLSGKTCAQELLRAEQIPLRTGLYSPFASFQDALALKLHDCGQAQAAASLAVERSTGIFGPASMAALQAAHSCGLISDARGGLTGEVWHTLAPDMPIPDLRDRIDVMILTFEATGFGAPPEWNLCQDGFESNAGAGPARCINHSDPCSFLTWGPRGATAGQGREIQWILKRVEQMNPGLLARAFGDELENVHRFLSLIPPPPEDCDGRTPLEHFMCALWLNESRRATWTKALTKLGQEELVRGAFHDVYALEAFDGYKLRAYFDLWNTLGIPPSEIDYAFFLDRATQIGPPKEQVEAPMRACILGEPAALNSHAAARRCLARLHPHPTLPVDRLARDVALYREGYPAAALTDNEIIRWQHHIPISAEANIALSDGRPVRLEEVLSRSNSIEAPQFDATRLTEAEQNCPASILRPERDPVPAR